LNSLHVKRGMLCLYYQTPYAHQYICAPVPPCVSLIFNVIFLKMRHSPNNYTASLCCSAMYLVSTQISHSHVTLPSHPIVYKTAVT